MHKGEAGHEAEAVVEIAVEIALERLRDPRRSQARWRVGAPPRSAPSKVLASPGGSPMSTERLTKFTKAKGSAAWKAMPRSRAASAR